MALGPVIWSLPDGLSVALSSVVWAVTSAFVGWRASRWSLDRVGRTGPVTQLRGWEDRGRFWQRTTRVRRWKDRLPEAGEIFGGISKKALPGRSTEALEGFRAETIRAERVHWLVMASWPLHLLWCRTPVAAGMLVFAVGFNAPFIVVQRSNRGRIDGLRSVRLADLDGTAAPTHASRDKRGHC